MDIGTILVALIKQKKISFSLLISIAIIVVGFLMNEKNPAVSRARNRLFVDDYRPCLYSCTCRCGGF